MKICQVYVFLESDLSSHRERELVELFVEIVELHVLPCHADLFQCKRAIDGCLRLAEASTMMRQYRYQMSVSLNLRYACGCEI